MNIEPDEELSVVVTRALGSVVVIVGGRVDVDGFELLHKILRDLVYDQGNVDVVLDLAGVDDGMRPDFVAAMDDLGTPLGRGRWRLPGAGEGHG